MYLFKKMCIILRTLFQLFVFVFVLKIILTFIKHLLTNSLTIQNTI